MADTAKPIESRGLSARLIGFDISPKHRHPIPTLLVSASGGAPASTVTRANSGGLAAPCGLAFHRARIETAGGTIDTRSTVGSGSDTNPAGRYHYRWRPAEILGAASESERKSGTVKG